MWNIGYSNSSGADDDGSGSVTILEAYRALIKSNFRPVQHVEFHWYSAEVSPSICPATVLNFSACPKEGGLLGSQAVAKSYEANGVNVIAMSQVSTMLSIYPGVDSWCIV
jgi:leucyl aminopeptidase